MNKSITVQQVMSREQVSRGTVYRWFAAGLASEIRTTKGIQRQRFVNVDDLDAWLRDHRDEATK